MQDVLKNSSLTFNDIKFLLMGYKRAITLFYERKIHLYLDSYFEICVEVGFPGVALSPTKTYATSFPVRDFFKQIELGALEKYKKEKYIIDKVNEFWEVLTAMERSVIFYRYIDLEKINGIWKGESRYQLAKRLNVAETQIRKYETSAFKKILHYM
ncbi:hypothetical protein LN42_01890 [Marinitoga sp. 1137]|uniref:hypothetical protein n=1 Tax=Marinitoga sp. 1137 TaxID=1545835 RepID=UPI000950600A|nr:hypothetical protein [Marinitoga sp. 1137]APT75050.1 hypothetical protein LN42_00535 [Marinitoga sp. 1137]APT75280.1 hypothetical protein LN42_01890 [Marinitoga sp. 1137]